MATLRSQTALIGMAGRIGRQFKLAMKLFINSKKDVAGIYRIHHCGQWIISVPPEHGGRIRMAKRWKCHRRP
jgi:hypothetical protein